MLKKLIVILAGGSGTRLWPLSRENHPKQFLDLENKGFSLLQSTVKRALKISDNILIIGNLEHRFIISEQLRQINAEKCKIILEPASKNTLPSVIVGCLNAIKYNFETIVMLPSDHIIENEEKFISYIEEASQIVHDNKKIGALGIKPNKPHTGYGYIEKNLNSNEIISFHEKPNLETAKKYIKNNNFLWNSGMFICDVQTIIEEIKQFEPELYENVEKSYLALKTEYIYEILNADHFNKIESVSIDYGVMEKTKSGIVIFCNDFIWSDVGNFETIYDISIKDNNNNNLVFDKNIILNNVKSSYIVNKSSTQLIVNNTENALVVATQDIIMVDNLQKNQNIKEIIKKLSDLNLSQIKENSFEYRPWGRYDNLFESDNFKIKKIVVLPQKQLSLQLHYKRSEHWICISGFGEVQIDEKIINLSAEDSVYIPVNTKHRIKNLSFTEDLIFIEVQSGTYFGEDDIVRFEDNFGRL